MDGTETRKFLTCSLARSCSKGTVPWSGSSAVPAADLALACVGVMRKKSTLQPATSRHDQVGSERVWKAGTRHPQISRHSFCIETLLEVCQMGRSKGGPPGGPSTKHKHGATEACPAYYKRASSAPLGDDEAGASTATQIASTDVRLDNFFALLVDKPTHQLYDRNLDQIVCNSIDGNAIHGAIADPLVRLLASVKQRCKGNSVSEEQLVAAVYHKFTEQALQHVADAFSGVLSPTAAKSETSVTARGERFDCQLNLMRVACMGDVENTKPVKQETTSECPPGFVAQYFHDPSRSCTEAGRTEQRTSAKEVNGHVRDTNIEQRDNSSRGAFEIPEPSIAPTSRTLDEANFGHLKLQFPNRKKSLHHYGQVDEPERKLLLQELHGGSSKLSVLEVMNVLRAALGEESGLQGAEERYAPVADARGIVRSQRRAFVVSFQDPQKAACADGSTLSMYNQAYTLKPLVEDTYQTFICSDGPSNAEDQCWYDTLQKLLAIFPQTTILCVQQAPKGLGPAARTHSSLSLLVVTLSHAMAIKGFSFDIISDTEETQNRPKGVKLRTLVFRPLQKEFPAACVVCDMPLHATESCPYLTPLLLQTSTGLHSRLVASLDDVKQTCHADEQGREGEEQSHSGTHNPKDGLLKKKGKRTAKLRKKERAECEQESAMPVQHDALDRA